MKSMSNLLGRLAGLADSWPSVYGGRARRAPIRGRLLRPSTTGLSREAPRAGLSATANAAKQARIEPSHSLKTRRAWSVPAWFKRAIALCAIASILTSPSFAQQPSIMPGPPFKVVQSGGAWWFEKPNGERFFSRGVCCVGQGATAADYDPTNPGYAPYREYPTGLDWANSTITRLKSWGFTTIGGWSDNSTLDQSPKMDMPYTVMIPIGMAAGAPWLDMWDPKIIATMDKAARDAILPVRDDPNLIGYFTDNELGWWKGALIQTTLKQQAPTSGQRERLVGLLGKHYHGSWDALLKDFVPKGADSFDALDRGGTVFLRPGGNGMVVESEFLSLVADRYYALVKSIVRKYDFRGLILGDRYQSFYYPEVAAAAGRYVDVQSTNVNASWNDGGLARFYLSTLHSLSHRPIMVTEFYVAATENRSGNKNDSSGFVVVPTQADRAEVFRHEMEQFLSRPYVVGADWFQYADEPKNGRGDGENYDMGLVDINDRPYDEITSASAGIDVAKLRADSLAAEPDISDSGVPRAPADPMAGKTDKEMLLGWERTNGFVAATSKAPTADLYACWDSGHLYLGVYSIDPVEKDDYIDGQLPAIDAPVLDIDIAGKPPIQIRLVDGGQPQITGAEGIAINHYGPQDNVRNSTIVALPASLLGESALAAGAKITMSVSLTSHARAYRSEWRIDHAKLAP
jgi:hypothetical protein